MSDQIPHDYSKQDVIDLANWLMAENAYFNNWIHSAMYEKQTELIGQLHDARDGTSTWYGCIANSKCALRIPARRTQWS
jgi:hypothetical protein